MQNRDGVTALSLAVCQERVETVQALLKAGAGTEQRSKDGLTALMYAVAGGAEVVRHLVNAGADRYARTCCGINVMHAAAVQGNVKVMKYFMDEGLDVNEPDFGGRTPVMYAAVSVKDANTLRAPLGGPAGLRAVDAGGHNVLWYLSKNPVMPEENKKLCADMIYALMQK